ncbi:MAG: molybdenum cofactor biosynthesis protein MoaE [Deltaproteobacteria bacterium]|jgi:molybdopterin synthase catalytic subunit|nr:molybdenum cofactor biosynthesis protein MoaE [Deltaproteobacteria bacterium]
MIDPASMIHAIKQDPRYPECGMILCHNGVVRGRSLSGRPVSALDVKVDRNRLEDLLAEQRQRPGIIDIRADIREGLLQQGEDIMVVVIAGSARKKVLPVLSEVIDRIKKEVVNETEYFG